MLAFPSASAADPTLPAVPDLPDAVEAPASVSQEPRRDGAGLGVVTDARFASVDAIPGRALTAYQRAETVIRQADPTCNLTWQLVAAIGKVESNHGRFGGALMTADGVVHPAILGPRLTGHGATSRIDDTDAGLLDGDASVRPGRGTDAVHPLDLDRRRRRRRRRRPARPPRHRRRQPGHRRLPLQRHRRPRHHGGPARRGPPLQPQLGVRRPRARHHGGLSARRPGAVPGDRRQRRPRPRRLPDRRRRLADGDAEPAPADVRRRRPE